MDLTQKPELTGNQSRFLIRRGLITAEGTLAFPILGIWLNESAEQQRLRGRLSNRTDTVALSQ